MDETATPSLQRKGRRASTEFDDSLSVRLIFFLAFVAAVIWVFNLGLALRYRNQTAPTMPPESPPVEAHAAEVMPATPATPAAPAAPLTTPRHRFAVQVGAYEDRAEAERRAQSFSSNYPYVLVTQSQVGGKVFHQVRIPVETKAEAKALAAKLQHESKIETWVVPLP